jgi:hypothetical protein
MKLLILLAFIGCALLQEQEQATLNGVFNLLERFFLRFGGDETLELTHIHRECVKNKVKLDEIGEKMASARLASSVILSAGLLCLHDKSKVVKVVQNWEEYPTPESVECFMRRLQELEPKSKFLSNFEVNPTETCPEPKIPQDKLDAEFEKITEKFEIINIGGCFKIDKKHIEIDFIKGSLAKVLLKKSSFGLSEDVENELVEMIRNEQEEKFKCGMDVLLKSIE